MIKKIYQWSQDRCRKLSPIDIKFIAWIGILMGIILVKLFPRILGINIWWFLIPLLILVIKTYYVFLFKK